MSQGNVEIVRRIFDSWAEGDLRGGADDLDPHVVFVVRRPFPEAAVLVGRERIREYMRGFLRQWVGYTIEAKDLRAIGDTILASAVQRGAGL
jgi:ketosteroid isomerase-like protein